jgi:hypothetical protein
VAKAFRTAFLGNDLKPVTVRAALGVPGDPREFWYADPVTDDVRELRATLREMSLRATGELRLIEISAFVPEDGCHLTANPSDIHIHSVPVNVVLESQDAPSSEDILNLACPIFVPEPTSDILK